MSLLRNQCDKGIYFPSIRRTRNKLRSKKHRLYNTNHSTPLRTTFTLCARVYQSGAPSPMRPRNMEACFPLKCDVWNGRIASSTLIRTLMYAVIPSFSKQRNCCTPTCQFQIERIPTPGPSHQTARRVLLYQNNVLDMS